ncbi:hypothetical protein F2P81_024980 [Scophthalmus maximus]|uniref:Uncharacterized protein n=1 Tax=Scophthalmus maximus TaxID=52904 RepID=A0A6A4RRT9_SCOMX|nr:hypothetical protein F2P81_024980 [Scophthalmus maximus]
MATEWQCKDSSPGKKILACDTVSASRCVCKQKVPPNGLDCHFTLCQVEWESTVWGIAATFKCSKSSDHKIYIFRFNTKEKGLRTVEWSDDRNLSLSFVILLE